MRLSHLLSTPHLEMGYHDGAGDGLVICFSSIGHDPTRPPAPEFVASAVGHKRGHARRALFVMDGGRSWGNDPDFAPALREAFARLDHARPIHHITALGLSMGGYAALVAAQILPVRAVLAFGPQSTLTQARKSPQWARWVDRITDPRWPAAPWPAPPCHSVLVHGLADDLPHAEGFALQPNMDHLLFPALSHSALLPALKSRGLLEGLVDAVIMDDRRRFLRILQGAGGIRRTARTDLARLCRENE